MDKPNLFNLPDPLPEVECFESLIQDRGVLIERIVSNGHATPDDEWYDQGRDEWVALLQGRAELQFDDGRTLRMSAGDHVLIPRSREASGETGPARIRRVFGLQCTESCDERTPGTLKECSI